MSLIQLSPDILPSMVTRLESIECEMQTIREISSKQTVLIQDQTSEIQDLKNVIANLCELIGGAGVPNVPSHYVEVPGGSIIYKPTKASEPLNQPERIAEEKMGGNSNTPISAKKIPTSYLPFPEPETSVQPAVRRHSERNNVLIFSPNTTPKPLTRETLVEEVNTDLPSFSAEQTSAQQQPSQFETEDLFKCKQADKEWSEVRRKKVRSSVSMRCVAGPAVTSLKAVEPRKYIHLWNMLSDADEVKDYLKKLYPEKSCIVQELKTDKNYKSFKIGVHEECFENCLSVNIWPENARVKKWINYKKSTQGHPSFRGEVGKQ